MVNKCELVYCRTGKVPSSDGEKISTFHFPIDDPEICDKWKYFVGKDDWNPSKYSVLCEKHFDPKYIKYGKQRNKLNYNLRPVPTIHTVEDGSVPESVLRVPNIPRPPPKERNIYPDEKPAYRVNDKIKSLDCLSGKNCPPGWSFRKHRDKVVFYNLQFDYVTSIPIVFESIVVDEKLHVTLSYKGEHIPLPTWFRDNRSNNNCKLDRFSMLTNFPHTLERKSMTLMTFFKK